MILCFWLGVGRWRWWARLARLAVAVAGPGPVVDERNGDFVFTPVHQPSVHTGPICICGLSKLSRLVKPTGLRLAM
eukprot:scaffold18596_cov126-Isochrysis_galbana.AAC.2